MRTEEHNLQVAIIELLRLNHIFCFAVPNGGRRDLITGARLKKEGVMSGVADIIILMPEGITHFIELKNGKKGRQSDGQKQFQKDVEALGFNYELWRSIDDCQNFIKKCK